MVRSTDNTSDLLRGVRTATFWIDESGSKATAAQCFVVAGIKTRVPDDLQRAVHAIRQQTGFDNELKFGRMGRHSFDVMTRIVDLLAQSDARIVATVVDHECNPFHGRDTWVAQADVISQLLVGSINRNEVATAMIDGISTPEGKSLGTAVRRKVNSRLDGSPLVAAVSLNSKTNDMLQVADMVAGAIRFRRQPNQGGATNHEKRQLTARLAAAFDLDSGFPDRRTDRVNIGHYRPQSRVSRRKGHLKVISDRQSVS